MSELSHTDNSGKARMVDTGGKPDQQREARAEGFIRLQHHTIQLIRDNQLKKGDVLSIAEIAGIQGAKKTSDLIPLCHPIPLTHVSVEASLLEEGVRIESQVKCTGKTGVEMEALTGANIALLTVYDMCKAVDETMIVETLRLIEKRKA